MYLQPVQVASLNARAVNRKVLLPPRKALLIASLSVALFVLAGVTTVKTVIGYKNDDIPSATNPACKGINLLEMGRSVHISSGFVEFGSTKVVSAAQTVHVPPCPPLQIRDENFRLFSATDAHPYFSRVPIACLAGGEKNGGPVGFLIDENSLTIEDENGKKLIADKDYRLDLRYDSIEKLNGCALAEGALVKLNYSVLRKRIDTLTVDRRGVFKLTTGKLSQFAPTPAIAPSHELAVAHIGAVSGDEAINRSCIMPISGATPSHTSVEDLCVNVMNLTNTKNKLAAHKKLQLLMCGDSVSCGAFSSDLQHSFPVLFQTQLQDKSQTKVELTKIAGGGKTSSALLQPILSALASKHPDLLVIEFVNDLSLSEDQIQKNYSQIFDTAKAAGTEVIVCLPHLPSPLFYGQSWQDIASKPYYKVIPPLARKHNCAVTDIAYRWLHISEEGLQPIDLLADQANHPNDYGHKIYADELMKTIFPTK